MNEGSMNLKLYLVRWGNGDTEIVAGRNNKPRKENKMELTKAESIVVAELNAGCTLLRTRRRRQHRRAAWQGGQFLCNGEKVAPAVVSRLLAKGAIAERGMNESGDTLFVLVA